MAEVVFDHPKIRRTTEELRKLMYTSEEASIEHVRKGFRMFKKVLQDPEIHKQLEEEFGIKDGATRTATVALKLLKNLHEHLQRDFPEHVLVKEGGYIPPLFSNLSVLATSTILESLMENPDVRDVPKLLAKIKTLRKYVRESLYIGDSQRRTAMLNLSLAYNLVKARAGDINAKAYFEHTLSAEAKKLKDLLESLPNTEKGEIARIAAINRYLLHYKVAKLAGIDVKEHAEVFRKIAGKYPEEIIQRNG